MLLTLLTLIGCGGTYALQGTLEDGVYGGPLGGFDLIASATNPDAVSLSCKKRGGKANDDGTFVIDGLCAGSTYTVTSPSDILLPDLIDLPDGGPSGPLTAKAFRAPGGDGLYLLTPKKGIEPVSSNASIKKDMRADGTEVVYPNRALKDPPLLAGDTALIATGTMATEAIRTLVMQPDGIDLEKGRLPACRTVGDNATPDASQVMDVTAGEHTIRIYKAGALPEGRYALWGEGNQRMMVFDAVAQQPAKAPEAPEAP